MQPRLGNFEILSKQQLDKGISLFALCSEYSHLQRNIVLVETIENTLFFPKNHEDILICLSLHVSEWETVSQPALNGWKLTIAV